MAIQALIPYALAAYGGYKGYQGAKDSGASGLGRILGGLTGAYTGYTLGSTGMSMFPQSAATKVTFRTVNHSSLVFFKILWVETVVPYF